MRGKQIMTVTGPVNANLLGTVYSHEHLIVQPQQECPLSLRTFQYLKVSIKDISIITVIHYFLFCYSFIFTFLSGITDSQKS